MSLKIACPHCGRSMTVKPKEGRFKLNCVGCQQAFALVVGSGDPPRFKVGKLADPSAATQPESVRPSDRLPAAKSAGTEQTLDAVPGQSSAAKAAPAGNSPPTMVEQVVPRAPKTPSSKNQTAKTQSASRESTPASLATADFGAATRTTAMAGKETVVDLVPPEKATMPARLGGYRILAELGRGGMGSVYLAKQISLDRKVAVKTIQAAWALNPQTIARFIREAYATAQLSHHNVVQIHDLGEDGGINFFSMEVVDGGSLQDLLRREGKVEPRRAAVYMLQAARGLKFAHDHGMVHRDVKPANLLLGADSLVKVADLGLVKTSEMQDEAGGSDADHNANLASARTHVTGAGSTMGTPAYMSPEQADDAANVDHRADIYSLGCTFFALLTGHPPFNSQNPLELISKHRHEQIVRPDRVVEGIPSALGSIVERMTARRPEDRYQDLGETIADLEKFLAGGTHTATTGDPAQIESLRAAADEYGRVPMARLRNTMFLALIVGCLLLAMLSATLSLRVASSWLLVMLATPIAVSVVGGLRTGASPLGSRLRASLVDSSWGDRATWAVMVLFTLLIAYALGLLGWWLTALIVAVLLAGGYHTWVPSTLSSQRSAALDQAEALLAELRLAGMEERSLQRFVAQNAGTYWEELFEQLFDYDSMRAAREVLKMDGKLAGKKRFQPWRDWLIDLLDKSVQQRRRAREQKVLAQLEQANLKSRGLSEAQAKQEANELAATMVMAATAYSRSNQTLAPQTLESAAEKRERIKAMLQAARTGKPKSLGAIAKKTTGAILDQVLGWKLRFVIGALMVFGCVSWANQNKLFDASHLSKLKDSASSLSQQELSPSDLSDLAKTGTQLSQLGSSLVGATTAWEFPVVGGWFDSFAPGLVGLLIVMSCLISGWRYSLFAIPAAAVTLLGARLGVPTLILPAEWLSGLIAVMILGVGVLLGRMPERDA